MRITKTVNKSNTTYYILKDYTKAGKRTTTTIKRIGAEAELLDKAKEMNISLDEYLKIYLNDYKAKYNKKREKKTITISKQADKIINLNENLTFNVGYLFLDKIYYQLKINEIIEDISKKYKFTFSLNDIFKTLISSRIIYPSSKLKTHELSKNYIEEPKLKLHNLYRGLTYLCKELDFIQEKLYNNSKAVIDRNSRIIYFDCTNYFFEIHTEDNLRKYGINKQHQPSPQVGMGLFLDENGIPIAFNIYPGNENEVKQLLPTEKKILDKYKLNDKRLILCTDAALNTDTIKYFNSKDNRGFVITQSLKKLTKEKREEALNPEGWRVEGDLRRIYNLDDIRKNETLRKLHENTRFYKILDHESKSSVYDIVVTYSIKYDEYQKVKRRSHIEKAYKKIKTESKDKALSKTNNQNDYRRFIKETAITKNKEEAKLYERELNYELILEEEKYDGFYALATNLIDEVPIILSVAKGRWQIEESFRIMKQDFLARPVEMSREDRITAHFLTCYIALLVYRVLEKKLNDNYTTNEIIETLRNMNVTEQKGYGYTPAYKRTHLTDDLHRIFSFNTDFEIKTYKDYQKVFNRIKQ